MTALISSQYSVLAKFSTVSGPSKTIMIISIWNYNKKTRFFYFDLSHEGLHSKSWSSYLAQDFTPAAKFFAQPSTIFTGLETGTQSALPLNSLGSESLISRDTLTYGPKELCLNPQPLESMGDHSTN